MKRGHRAPPRRQRGVALIIALILVALAAILATKLTFDSWIERRRSLGIMATEQAFHFGMGAEALAADVLSQIGQTSSTQSKQAALTGTAPQTPTNPQQVNLAQPWAQPTQPLPITPQDDPEGEPIGTLQGSLEDMQGRFNLNNLAHMVNVNGQIIEDPFPLLQFQRILVAVDWNRNGPVSPAIGSIRMISPGSPTAQRTPSTLLNTALPNRQLPDDQRERTHDMPGFGADRYRKIAPYVTALPTATAKINVCTAPGVVIESLAENMNGEYSQNPEVLASGRKSGCFPDVATLNNIIGPQAQGVATRFGDTSTYFRLTTRVTLGTTEFTLYSLLWRSSGAR